MKTNATRDRLVESPGDAIRLLMEREKMDVVTVARKVRISSDLLVLLISNDESQIEDEVIRRLARALKYSEEKLLAIFQGRYIPKLSEIIPPSYKKKFSTAIDSKTIGTQVRLTKQVPINIGRGISAILTKCTELATMSNSDKHRYFACIAFDICLDYAAKKVWSGFSCINCPFFHNPSMKEEIPPEIYANAD